jgi:hypothetical protein
MNSVAGVIITFAVLIGGCMTIPLTTEESAGLKEAQRFADEVTNAYRA